MDIIADALKWTFLLIRALAAIALVPVLLRQCREVREANGYKKHKRLLFLMTLAAELAILAGMLLWIPSGTVPLVSALTTIGLAALVVILYVLYFKELRNWI